MENNSAVRSLLVYSVQYHALLGVCVHISPHEIPFSPHTSTCSSNQCSQIYSHPPTVSDCSRCRTVCIGPFCMCISLCRPCICACVCVYLFWGSYMSLCQVFYGTDMCCKFSANAVTGVSASSKERLRQWAHMGIILQNDDGGGLTESCLSIIYPARLMCFVVCSLDSANTHFTKMNVVIIMNKCTR